MATPKTTTIIAVSIVGSFSLPTIASAQDWQFSPDITLQTTYNDNSQLHIDDADQDELISRKIPSKIANWLIGKVTGVPIKDNGCSLKAFRSSVIKQVPLYNEMHRFIPAMASITGARIAEIKVRHHARQFGKSKYGLSRVYKVLLDMLTVKMIVGFAQRPLIWFGFLSMPFFLVGSIAIVVSLLPLLKADDAMSVPLAGTGILLSALGILLILGGALGELIYSTGKSVLVRQNVPVIVQRVDLVQAGTASEGSSNAVKPNNA